MENLIVRRAKKVVAMILVGGMCLSLGGCSTIANAVLDKLQGTANVAEVESESEEEYEFDDENSDFEDDDYDDYDDYEYEDEKKEERIPQDYDVELSDNLEDFEFALEGEVYSMPMWFSDFEAMGWEFQDDRTVELDSYEYVVYQLWEMDGMSVETHIINLSLNRVSVEDCLISYICFSKEDGISAEMPCDIVLHEATYDDVIAAYGEPDDISDGLYKQISYTFDYDRHISFDFDPETDELINVFIENVDPDFEGLDKEVSTDVPDDIADYEPADELSNDLYDIAFDLDGVVYELPCPVAYFLDNGFTIAEDYQETVVPAGRTDFIRMRYDNQEINVQIYNNTANALYAENCWLMRFDAYDYGELIKLNILIPEDITVGMTVEEVLAILDEGGYNYEFSYEGSDDYIVYADEDEKYDIYIRIEFLDSIVSGFEFSAEMD